MSYHKKIAVMIFGIILIVGGAFVMASLVHKESVEVLDIEESIKVGSKTVNFKLYRVDQSFFIQIPDDFIILDEVTLKEKYGLSERPELIFQTEDDLTHIFVTTTDYQVNDTTLAGYVDAIKSGFNGFTIQNYEVKESYGKPFVHLSGIDEVNQVYKNIRYFTYDDKLMIVEFNTPVLKSKDWSEASTYILDSICFNEEDAKKK